jgi:DNA-binding MarR family transcriptional regulator
LDGKGIRALEPEAADEMADLSASLELLAAVEERPDVTQRGLAQRMGVALGLTNAYLRRAMGKGLIKVRQAPARRYLYYLTPQGFAEKARLTREFLSDSFGFFRRARAECDDLIARAAASGQRRILLVGASELAEIATLAARDHGVEMVGVYAPGRNTARFAGLPVVRSLAEAGAFDAALLVDIQAPQRLYDGLIAELPPERILCPRMLRIVRTPAVEPA